MIYTASYFHPEHHHGKLVSVSRSNPKEFVRIPRLDFFAPSKDLLSWWKKSSQADGDWEDYQSAFFDELDANFQQIDDWIEKAPVQHDITLLCWEHPGDRCHRNDVGQLIAARAFHLWGGFDVPLTQVEQLVLKCNQAEKKARCDRLTTSVYGFFLHQLWLGKKDLGIYTEAGALGLLAQILEPTYSESWRNERGVA